MQESQRKEHRIFLGLNQCCGAGAALFLAIETLGMGGSGTACGTYLNQNGSNIELKFLKLIFRNDLKLLELYFTIVENLINKLFKKIKNKGFCFATLV